MCFSDKTSFLLTHVIVYGGRNVMNKCVFMHVSPSVSVILAAHSVGSKNVMGNIMSSGLNFKLET